MIKIEFPNLYNQCNLYKFENSDMFEDSKVSNCN